MTLIQVFNLIHTNYSSIQSSMTHSLTMTVRVNSYRFNIASLVAHEAFELPGVVLTLMSI